MIAIWVAVSFLMLMGFLALVVDVGHAYVVKRQLQAAADSAALTACDIWIETRDDTASSTVGAYNAALRYKNGPTAGLTNTNIFVQLNTSTPPKSVRVILTYPVDSLFGGLLGRARFNVRAEARAQMQVLAGVRYAAPWGVTIFGRPTGASFYLRNASGGGAGFATMYATSADGLTWTGNTAAPLTPGAYDVMLRFNNDAGSAEFLLDTYRSRETTAARLFVRGAGQPVQSVTWDRPLFTESDGSYGPTPGYQWPTITANVSGTTQTVLGKPGIVYNTLLATHEAKIATTTVAYVQQIRVDHPVRNVTVSPVIANPGANIRVDVQFGGFDPRDRADTVTGIVPRIFFLRQSNGSYTGDYVQLDYANMNHGDCGYPAFNKSGMPDTWPVWIKTGYPGAVHTNELLYFDKTPTTDLINTYGRQRMVLPVVMRTGPSMVRVVGFVGFRPVERTADGGTTVRGIYETYASVPHQFATGTPPPYATTDAVYAARLVR